MVCNNNIMMIESDRVIAVGEVTVVAEVKTIGTTSYLVITTTSNTYTNVKIVLWEFGRLRRV